MSVDVSCLPEDFLKNIKSLLKDEYSDFISTYAQPAFKGAHFSARRGAVQPLQWAESVIPWAENGWYLEEGSQPGSSPLHWAGRYYIQEPSAMAAVSALSVEPGDKVLDLCAAPGGKSSQIANSLKGRGLLISNDSYLSRARELSRNMERMGVSNCVVTANRPEQLSSFFPGFFDKILVDAPCSGEGMFRKEPEVISHWHKDLPKQNALRQLEILRQAALMLRPGGSLLYSTCTFNQVENEGVIDGFLKAHPDFSLHPFSLQGLAPAKDGIIHLWPHRVRGEGHFLALLKRSLSNSASQAERTVLRFNVLSSKEKTPSEVKKLLQEWVVEKVEADAVFSGAFVKLPDDLPNLEGLTVLRLGLHLCKYIGKTLVPDHALALALTPRKIISFDESLAERYREGQPIKIDDHLSGFCAAAHEGWPIGWGKASLGTLKNHYPKGLRKPG